MLKTIPNEFKRNENESEQSFIVRVGSLKDKYNYTWDTIAYICNDELDMNHSESYYRKKYKLYLEDAYLSLEDADASTPEDYVEFVDASKDEETHEDTLEALQAAIRELRTERIRLQDERTQNNAMIRRMSREDSIINIAHDAAMQFNDKFILPSYSTIKNTNSKCEGVLLISDVHYGSEINSIWNKYNPTIAKERFAKLCQETIRIGIANKISNLHIVNLGDLISGRIHLQLRINSRIDVITQIMEISEILAEFISNLSKHFNIDYYDCLDNHSRLEPNLKESLDLESLTRITSWFLKERLHGNVTIHDNHISDDIIAFESLGHKIIGVHGDKDKPSKIIDGLSMMTKEHYDMVVSAHLHHFSCEEKNETVLISNASMMGTDDYAEKLRLSSDPSQTLIIVTPENVTESIHRIVLS